MVLCLHISSDHLPYSLYQQHFQSSSNYKSTLYAAYRLSFISQLFHAAHKVQELIVSLQPSKISLSVSSWFSGSLNSSQFQDKTVAITHSIS